MSRYDVTSTETNNCDKLWTSYAKIEAARKARYAVTAYTCDECGAGLPHYGATCPACGYHPACDSF